MTLKNYTVKLEENDVEKIRSEGYGLTAFIRSKLRKKVEEIDSDA